MAAPNSQGRTHGRSRRGFHYWAPPAQNRYVRLCRVAQPLLAFAPTEPTVRRYRSGLFRKDRRRIDQLCQACWMTGSGSGKAVRSLL